MENYNEKEVKMIEYSVVICLILFVIFGGLYLKNNEKEKAQQQVVSVEQQEKIWEETIHKAAEEKKLPAAWTVNAYRDARDFFKKYEHKDVGGISRKSLSDYLVYMKLYTREVADFAAFHVQEDFKEQAVLYAKDEQEYPGQYSENHPENEDDLRRALTLAYFTDEEKDYAVKKMFNK